MQHIPRWLIEKTANAHGVDARRFSETSHFVMLMLGHLSHASCLTEICDDASLNAGRLRLVRNATPGKRNTFSHANRTRPAEVAEEVYWATAKMHVRLPIGSFIPSVVRIEAGRPHDSTADRDRTTSSSVWRAFEARGPIPVG